MLRGLSKVQQLKSILCQGSLVLLTVSSRIVTIRGPVLFLDLHFLCEIVPECCKTIRGYYPSLPNYKALYTTRHVAKFRIFVENPCNIKVLRNGIFPGYNSTQLLQKSRILCNLLLCLQHFDAISFNEVKSRSDKSLLSDMTLQSRAHPTLFSFYKGFRSVFLN